MKQASQSVWRRLWNTNLLDILLRFYTLVVSILVGLAALAFLVLALGSGEESAALMIIPFWILLVFVYAWLRFFPDLVSVFVSIEKHSRPATPQPPGARLKFLQAAMLAFRVAALLLPISLVLSWTSLTHILKRWLMQFGPYQFVGEHLWPLLSSLAWFALLSFVARSLALKRHARDAGIPGEAGPESTDVSSYLPILLFLLATATACLALLSPIPLLILIPLAALFLCWRARLAALSELSASSYLPSRLFTNPLLFMPLLFLLTYAVLRQFAPQALLTASGIDRHLLEYYEYGWERAALFLMTPTTLIGAILALWYPVRYVTSSRSSPLSRAVASVLTIVLVLCSLPVLLHVFDLVTSFSLRAVGADLIYVAPSILGNFSVHSVSELLQNSLGTVFLLVPVLLLIGSFIAFVLWCVSDLLKIYVDIERNFRSQSGSSASPQASHYRFLNVLKTILWATTAVGCSFFMFGHWGIGIRATEVNLGAILPWFGSSSPWSALENAAQVWFASGLVVNLVAVVFMVEAYTHKPGVTGGPFAVRHFIHHMYWIGAVLAVLTAVVALQVSGFTGRFAPVTILIGLLTAVWVYFIVTFLASLVRKTREIEFNLRTPTSVSGVFFGVRLLSIVWKVLAVVASVGVLLAGVIIGIVAAQESPGALMLVVVGIVGGYVLYVWSVAIPDFLLTLVRIEGHVREWGAPSPGPPSPDRAVPTRPDELVESGPAAAPVQLPEQAAVADSVECPDPACRSPLPSDAVSCGVCGLKISKYPVFADALGAARKSLEMKDYADALKHAKAALTAFPGNAEAAAISQSAAAMRDRMTEQLDSLQAAKERDDDKRVIQATRSLLTLVPADQRPGYQVEIDQAAERLREMKKQKAASVRAGLWRWSKRAAAVCLGCILVLLAFIFVQDTRRLNHAETAIGDRDWPLAYRHLFDVNDPLRLLSGRKKATRERIWGEEARHLGEIEQAAKEHIRAGRLTAPPGRNAYEIIRQLPGLRIQNGDNLASSLLMEISEIYEATGDAARNRGDLDEARELYEEANRLWDLPSPYQHVNWTASRLVSKAANPCLLYEKNGLGMDMVLIPAGTFTMGSPHNESQRNDDERAHRVTISKPFWVSTTEVTTTAYKLREIRVPSGRWSGDPCRKVTWFDAVEYCNRLSERDRLSPCYRITGSNVDWDRRANGYRLPTEAEWEYMCRAGTVSMYHFGESRKAGTYENLAGYLEKVGSRKPNPWGLYDIHGNAGEWCWDRYAKYPKRATTDPAGPSGGSTKRVIRGGGIEGARRLDHKWRCRSANRASAEPSWSHETVSFRVVRNATDALQSGHVSREYRRCCEALYWPEKSVVHHGNEEQPSPSDPFFMRRRVTESDLRGKSDWDLDVMRNEIYARHGRSFRRSDLQAYFNRQSWYSAKYLPDGFPVSLLTQVQVDNAAFILRYQKRVTKR